MLTLSSYSAVSPHEAPYSPTIVLHKSPSGRSLKSYRTKAVVYVDRGVGASPPAGVARAPAANKAQAAAAKSSLPAPTNTTEASRAAAVSVSRTGHQTAAPQQPRRQPSQQSQPESHPSSSTLEPARSISQLAIKRHASDSSSSPPDDSTSSLSNDEPMSSSADAAPKSATDALTKNFSTSTTLTSDNDNTSPTKKHRPSPPARKPVPKSYEDCPTTDLVQLIAAMLLELISYNDAIPLKDGHLTRFHSRAPPGISVQDYLQRLTTHATLSPPILLSMVYYIDRLCALYPAFTITSLTVHRFLISSATVASKGLSDSFWTNKTYARVGGVSLNELALLELEFLTRLEWRIVPRPEVLVDYYRSLVKRSEGFVFEEEGAEGVKEGSKAEQRESTGTEAAKGEVTVKGEVVKEGEHPT